MAGDYPDVPFVQALKFGEGRPDGPPLWIVWHTTEEHELADTAERVAHYFATLPDGRTVSSHYVHDNNSSVQCVRLADRAWTVGNRPGNNRGINVELAGFASQGAAGWADAYSQAMLRRACAIARRDMARYGIPNRWCTIDDLIARRPGHTTHNDLRVAFGGTTHTDPGPTFPRSLVLALVAGEETDMPTADEVAHAVWWRDTSEEGGVQPAWKMLDGVYQRTATIETDTAARLAAIEAKLDGLAAQPAATLTEEQVEKIAQQLIAATDNPLGEADKPAIVAGVKQALREGAA